MFRLRESLYFRFWPRQKDHKNKTKKAISKDKASVSWKMMISGIWLLTNLISKMIMILEKLSLVYYTEYHHFDCLYPTLKMNQNYIEEDVA